MVCNGLAQPAEGILNAGFDLARTVGAVMACRCWLGRWLGRVCRPGGSGSNRRGLDARSRPWRPSRVAVRTDGQAGAKIRGELRGAGLGSDTLCLLPGRVDPVGDVTPQ